MNTKGRKPCMVRFRAILTIFVLFSPELFAPTPLWLKQTLFGQKRTSTWGVMSREGLVLLDVGCAAGAPFLDLIVCGTDLTWRWFVHVCVPSCGAYVPDLKHSMSCLNTYVWCHIPTLTMTYDQDPTENGYTHDWDRCAVVTGVSRVMTSTFYRCNHPNLDVGVGR